MSVTISASEVNKLRQQTGAGMMDCRAALQESNGDFEAAIDYLRKKGQKVAAKRSDREAKEGVVIAKTSVNNSFGIIVNVTSETDFVSKNQDFIDFGAKISDLAVSTDCKSLEQLKATSLDGSTVQDKLDEMVGKIGEKIDITSFERLEAPAVVAYNHGSYRVAVLVALSKPSNDAIQAAGRDICMQIAAMNPVAVDANSVAPEVIEREKRIIMDTMKEDPKMAGKPEEMIAKIAEGKLGAFFKENTLTAQAFVKDGSMSVADYLKSIEGGIQVNEFKRLHIG